MKADLDRRLQWYRNAQPELRVRAVAVHGSFVNYLARHAGLSEIQPDYAALRETDSCVLVCDPRGALCWISICWRRIVEKGTIMVTVFLVDDHEVVRRGLIDLLSADPEIEIVGEAGTVARAMAQIPALQPDVAVLDVRLPDGNGIELCRDLLSRLPDLRCLMLTSFTSDEAMLDAILAGASGYVIKDIKGMELAQAIRDVGAGRSLLDNRAAAALMARLRGEADRVDPLAALTDQEKVLLDLLAEGLTNRQIADRMFLAEKTVKNYVSRLLAKLGMQRRTQAAVFASKLNRTPPHIL